MPISNDITLFSNSNVYKLRGKKVTKSGRVSLTMIIKKTVFFILYLITERNNMGITEKIYKETCHNGHLDPMEDFCVYMYLVLSRRHLARV